MRETAFISRLFGHKPWLSRKGKPTVTWGRKASAHGQLLRVERLPKEGIAIKAINNTAWFECVGVYKTLRRSIKRLITSVEDTVGTTGVILISVLLLAVLSSLLTLLLSSGRALEVSGDRDLFEDRNYILTPFNLIDAYDVCVRRAQTKMGAGLLRAHLLPLSTRFETDSGSYLMVISVDVGTAAEWQVATIYCEVDPKIQEVSYYKEVYQGRPSFISRAMSSLDSMFD